MKEIDELYDRFSTFGITLGVTGSFATSTYNIKSDIDTFMIGNRTQVVNTIINPRFRELLPDCVVNDDVLAAIIEGRFNVFCAKGNLMGRKVNMELYTYDTVERLSKFDVFWMSRFRTRVTGSLKYVPYKSPGLPPIYSAIYHQPTYGAFDTILLSVLFSNGRRYLCLHYDKLMKALLLQDNNNVKGLINSIIASVQQEAYENGVDWQSVFYQKGVDDYRD